MTIPRRRFLHLAAGAAALPMTSHVAWAQAYPARPVRWIIGFAPGGTTDAVSRPIVQHMSENLGQPFIIESRPGAATNLATEMVARSPADGYTLLFIGSPNTINTSLYTKLNFNFSRDIAPVCGIVSVPSILVVHPSVPARTVPEFIAYTKANPGKINMASSGIGSTPHLAGEMFKMMAGVDIQHVPYRGAAPAMTDVLAGQVDVFFSTTPSSMQFIKSGQLRALAVTTAKRLSELPDLPAISEFVPGYDANAWYGLGAPKDTPADIISTLNRAINAAVADASIKKRFDDLGCTIVAGSPADLAKLIADETERWAKVVRFAGLKAD